jgi:GNAT superfamily N-acetyltransferase
MEIHRARPEQAPQLSEIARAAKASWGYPPRWLELWKAALTITPEFIAENPVFVATFEDEVAAFVALVRESDTRWALDHLWVSPSRMNQGIGPQLVRFASEFAGARGVRELTIDAEPRAESFYARMGAMRVGEAVDTLDGEARVRPQMVLYTGAACKESPEAT